MTNVSTETIVSVSIILVFLLIIAGMVFSAIKTKDTASRVKIIARLIAVAVLFIGFLFIWFKPHN